MSAQACVVLRTFCLLLSMAPAFCGESASHHTTNETVTTTGYNTSAPESASSTMVSLDTANFTTKAQDVATTNTPKAQSPKKPMETEPTSNKTSHSFPYVQLIAGLLFFCILVALIYCSYNWYNRHGRPSFREIWRIVAESARNAQAAVAARLSPSSKEEEEDEEMEAGEENKQGGDDEDDNNDDDDDSSDSYSSMGGTMTMVEQKKDEQEDGQRNESEDDMTPVKLQDEKPEREMNDLTVL